MIWRAWDEYERARELARQSKPFRPRYDWLAITLFAATAFCAVSLMWVSVVDRF